MLVQGPGRREHEVSTSYFKAVHTVHTQHTGSGLNTFPLHSQRAHRRGVFRAHGDGVASCPQARHEPTRARRPLRSTLCAPPCHVCPYLSLPFS